MKHLLLHSVAGVMGFVSIGMGSTARGLECISRPKYLQWTSDRLQAKHGIRRRTRKGSISNAMKDIGVGVYYGISGLVRQPVEGMNNDGILGFVSGTGKGTVGVIALPAAGVARFFSKVAEGLGDLAGPKELRKPHVRVRAPRVMEMEAAASKTLLLNHVQRTFSILEVDCLQEDLPQVVHLIDGKLYVLTENHIVCLTAAKGQQDPHAASVHWYVNLQQVVSLKRSSEYVKIKYSTQVHCHDAEQDESSSKTGSEGLDNSDIDDDDDDNEVQLTGWQKFLYLKKRRIWCPSFDQRDVLFDEIRNLLASKRQIVPLSTHGQSFGMTYGELPTDGCTMETAENTQDMQTEENVPYSRTPSQSSLPGDDDDVGGCRSLDRFCSECGFEFKKAGARFCGRCGAPQGH